MTMTAAKPASSSPAPNSKLQDQLLEEKRLEEERMHDVLLLLENLVQREEATAKILLDGIYDVATTNLINNRIHFRPLNRTAKSLARVAKPAAKVVGLRWFKQNCPQLVTNWLKIKVAFAPPKPKKKPTPKPQKAGSALAVPAHVQTSTEVKQLRAQVSLLTSLLIGAIAVFGTGFVWLAYNLQQESARQVRQVEYVLIEPEELQESEKR